MEADRSKFVGGSDIASIIGISPWRNVVELWLDKTQPQPDEDSAVKKRGRRLERYMLDLIDEEYGIVIGTNHRNVRHIDKTVPYFAAEIDAESSSFNVELKTVHPFKAAEWGDLQSDQLPLHYLAQIQWGLGVTARDLCKVFALIGDDLRPYEVARDDITISALRERAQDFWQRYVIPREQPPLDLEDPEAIGILKRLYPGTNGATIEATPDLERWRLTLEDARALADKYENVATGAKAHLLEEMGEAALLKFADGRALRRKFTTRKGYTVAETKYMDVRFISLKDGQ